MKNIQTFTEKLMAVHSFTSKPLVVQRRDLGVNGHLAEAREVSEYVGSEVTAAGMEFLQSIHDELTQKDPEWQMTDEERIAARKEREWNELNQFTDTPCPTSQRVYAETIVNDDNGMTEMAGLDVINRSLSKIPNWEEGETLANVLEIQDKEKKEKKTKPAADPQKTVKRLSFEEFMASAVDDISDAEEDNNNN